jgi:succinate dehydrogenase/fumarate reductase-like Fe-S protein
VTAADQNPLTVVKAARLRIWRGTNRESGRYEEFDVEFEDGDSVLDGLVRLRVSSDPSLAFRFSCFNANVCKECTMLIDGTVEYACIAKLQARVMQIEPLPNLEIVRDLVTDTLSRKERF